MIDTCFDCGFRPAAEHGLCRTCSLAEARAEARQAADAARQAAAGLVGKVVFDGPLPDAEDRP